MNKFNIAYNEIIGAKDVKVKQDRKCRHCNKIINRGNECITASHLTDKRYNVTFRDCVDKGLKSTQYKFVPVRHWLCIDCYNKIKNMRLCINRINLATNEVEDIIYSEEFTKLSANEQLKRMQTLYAKGLLSSNEFDYLEKELIGTIALEDAYFNEF